MGVATALLEFECRKLDIKKQKKQGYLPAKSCTKSASTWARKFISLHTYKRKRKGKLKAGVRILDCGADLSLMVRSGSYWSESSTIRDASVSTTSHFIQAGGFVDPIYLSYFSQALKLYCYYLVGHM